MRPRRVLFLRRLPRRLYVSPHRITAFWTGLGRRVRAPGAAALRELRAGQFSDVVDIGLAGALDPELRGGDLVLSATEVPFDTGQALSLRRRPDAARAVRGLAEARGVRLQQAPVLTHERPVLSRRDRLAWFGRTGCAAVQMEHAWAVQRLQSLLPAAVFGRLCFTHLVLISDAVPAAGGWRQSAGCALGALRALGAFASQRAIRRLRRDFLERWLS